ncbi:MAG: hypothetical protein H5T72_01700, partial [Actinobacteria bacterium]|nr:hypothetical protein [Actinomycetota bacterium]
MGRQALEVAVMECPFHAGNEAITSCAQCDTPICPLCATETNQVLLCMNCYRSRVEELGAGLSSASARLAKERKKAEVKQVKPFSKRAKEGVEAEAPAEAPLSRKELARLRREEAKRRREEAKRLKMEKKRAKQAEAEAEAPEAPPPQPVPFVQPPEEAEAPAEAPLSRKELARLRREEAKRRREEAKRLKMEKKRAK